MKREHTTSYTVEDGVFCRVRGGNTIHLCNFTAYILEGVIYNMGNVMMRKYAIEGVLFNGDLLPRIEVAVSKLSGMSWVCQWGPRPYYRAGYGIKTHLAAAIEYLSGEVLWRKVNLDDYDGIKYDEREKLKSESWCAYKKATNTIDKASAIENVILAHFHRSREDYERVPKNRRQWWNYPDFDIYAQHWIEANGLRLVDDSDTLQLLVIKYGKPERPMISQGRTYWNT